MRGDLLTEVQTYSEAAGAKWMNVSTERWDQYAIQEPPVMFSQTIGLTAKDLEVEAGVTRWCEAVGGQDDPGQQNDELFSMAFVEFVVEMVGEQFHLGSMTGAAFPAEYAEDQAEQDPLDAAETLVDLDQGIPVEEVVSDETFLDTVEDQVLPSRRLIEELRTPKSEGSHYKVAPPECICQSA